MSLEDLVPYLPAQGAAISRILEDPNTFLDYDYGPTWSAFKESIWGKSLAAFQEEKEVKKDDDPVEGIQIPPGLLHSVVTPPNTIPSAWDIDVQRILVRSEYYETERAVLSANERATDAFIVSGQPGIGPFPSSLRHPQTSTFD